MTGRRVSEGGFTLVELMVALFIFGILSAAGVALLRFSVDSQTASSEALADMGAIRRLNAALTNDLGQIAPRPARDVAGQRQNAFYGGGGADGDLLISFVRRGWSNYNGEARSSLQKVDYRLVDGVLERRAYPYVDGADALSSARLVSGIESIALRYRSEGEWRDRWDPTLATELPDAVELIVEIEGLGPLRQLFQTGATA
ncbi:type II secretion system minor pseudopilin GspJ [Parasphingopyxis algicola]|uniref:type II secretion system minor pseudopilin GspJ n=1 Tax=Parasphingopyxis algicola TaxID=2026624 RepID=UPI0015A0C8F8|nr:type II secretion system minor pseudopilin GspJ [Parasphingopyxis algicola]QLC23887.1 type II secretion system minor pseudopilin GspJ [Parasphingopyxis algicola]